MNTIELQIAQLRAGISKEKIAKILDMNLSTLYRKLNGESDFTLTELKKLRRVLKLSKDDIDCIFFSDELTETQVGEQLEHEQS